MSYLKKIEYDIILKGSFWVIRSCPKCGRKTNFINTKKFRVNANGNKLDIWLIYQCEECRHTLNLAIYERQKVSSLSKGEYQRFLDNDEQLAESYGKNMQLFRKNKVDVDFDRINYDFVKRHEDIEEGSGVLEQIAFTVKYPAASYGAFDPRAVAKCKHACAWLVAYARINNPYGLKIRPEKQIAEVLGLSRSQVKSLLKKGEIEFKMEQAGKSMEVLL